MTMERFNVTIDIIMPGGPDSGLPADAVSSRQKMSVRHSGCKQKENIGKGQYRKRILGQDNLI